MKRFFGLGLFAVALVALPASAQTPQPVPLPQWFVEIDIGKKGEVTRAEFLKYRMKSFDELDVNKDGKLSLDEFIKVAEPPFSADVPNGPTVEERRSRARSEFHDLDTNRNSFVERAELEAVVHSEFNQYDTDRDNKVTEPEVRLIVQRSLAREAAARQQIEARRRQGMTAIHEFIDMHLKEVDRLDKNNDSRLSQQEYVALAGPADGQQAQGLLPYDIRRQLIMRKFQEIDTNKDGQLDRVEVTAYAVKPRKSLSRRRKPTSRRCASSSRRSSRRSPGQRRRHNPRPPLPRHQAWRPACRSARDRQQRALLDRHTLGEVARLVDVGALGDRRVVGEHLHRHGVENRRHHRVDRR